VGETDLLKTGNAEYMTMRCLIGDELALELHDQALRSGKQHLQVVSLGAGMDSRAFRLRLPSATVFELDKPELFAVKEPLVQGVPLTCRARRLVVGTLGGDFDLGAALRAQGFDASLPSCWLLEGLAPYLAEPDLALVLSQIGALASEGSGIWLDGFSHTSVGRGMVFYGVPFESGSDSYDELLRESGFADAHAFDTHGVYVEEGKVVWDQRYQVTRHQLEGRPACLAVRGYA